MFIHNKQKKFTQDILSLQSFYTQYATIDSSLESSIELDETTQLISSRGNELDVIKDDHDDDRSMVVTPKYFKDATLSSSGIDEIKDISEMDERYKWLILNDYRFPLCMQHDIEKLSKTELLHVSKRDGLIIIAMVLQNSLFLGVEAAVTAWYTVYLEDKYDSTIVISTAQLTVCTLFLILGMQAMTIIGEKLKAKQFAIGNSARGDHDESMLHVRMKYNLKNFFVMSLIVSYAVLILLTSVVIPYNIFDPNDNSSYIGTFWVYVILMGFFWGFAAMGQEIILLEIQPKHMTGRVAGIKELIRFTLRGSITLIIGLLWNLSYEWFWYVQGVCYVSSFILLLGVMIAES